MKTKKNYVNKNNNTKKSYNKSYNKNILVPFEKKYEKTLKPSLTKAYELRKKNLKKLLNCAVKLCIVK